MNPFTESTVARPLACQGRSPTPFAAVSRAKRKRRTFVGMMQSPKWRGKGNVRSPARVQDVATPSVEAPAAGTPAAVSSVVPASVAGTFVTAASLLAVFFLPGLAFALDVNAATQEQLRKVRGIGPKTAQIIIEERSRGGRYESLEDLSDRVKGIGAKKAAALQAAGLSAGSSGVSSVSRVSGASSISGVGGGPSSATGVTGASAASRAVPPAAGRTASAPTPASAPKLTAPASASKSSGPAVSRSVFRLPSQSK